MNKPSECLRCKENSLLEPLALSFSISDSESRKNYFGEKTNPEAITFSIYICDKCGHSELIIIENSLEKVKKLKKVQIA